MHIYRRNRTYYYRVRIPKSLIALFGRKEIHKSLKTANRTVANRHAKMLHTHFEFITRGFALRNVRDDEIKHAIERFVQLQFEDNDKLLYEQRHIPGKTEWLHHAFEKHCEYLDKQMAREVPFDGMLKHYAENALNALEKPYSGDDHTYLCEQIAHGFKQALQAVMLKIGNGAYEQTENPYFTDYTQKLLKGEPLVDASSPAFISFNPDRSVQPSVTLQTAYDDFIRHTSVSKHWTLDTQREHENIRTLVLMHFKADTPVERITRQQLLDFRDALLSLPKNRTLKKAYRDLDSLDQMADKARELGDDTVSVTTVNKYLSLLYGFFDYCVENDTIQKNPVSNLRLNAKSKKSKQRTAYDKEDLEKLFAAPLYTRNVQQSMRTHPERLFIPLLALFQGARMNELCQLYKEDIIEVDGVWCININRNQDKAIKNDDSVRMIPLHETVIRSGFLTYIQNLTTPRLWPNLEKVEKYADAKEEEGRYSKEFSRWYRTKINRSYITNDPKKVFHSFRHTAAVSLIRAQVPGEYIAALLGHTQDLQMTFNTYGEAIAPKILKPYVDRIGFEAKGLNEAVGAMAEAVGKL